ncbi:MAG: V-type ATP synthase subunit F [Chloroflexota bacterium]|nr:V-type ATP synthase subunit F [Chloroflexota bacterium]
MELRVVGSQDAVRGFALAGVGGEVVEDAAALRQALSQTLGDAGVGIVLVTEDVAAFDRLYVGRLKLRSTVPLLVEIPGATGPSADCLPLGEMVHRMTGVKV